MRYLYILLSLMISVMPSMADSRSEKLLNEMSSAINTLGRYKVSFEIVSSDVAVMDGEYIVDGNIFKLSIAGDDIYGDGASRMSINHTLKEVVIEAVEDGSSIVITNPAQAFRRVSESFSSEIIDNNKDYVLSIKLTPRKDDMMIDSSILEINSKTMLPCSAHYISDGEEVEVKILDIESTTATLESLDDMTLPEGYDIIDIRLY